MYIRNVQSLKKKNELLCCAKLFETTDDRHVKYFIYNQNNVKRIYLR